MFTYIKLFLLLTGLSLLLCNNKENIGENETISCLKIDLQQGWRGKNWGFNEKWIAEKKIKKIVERIYSSDEDGNYSLNSLRVLCYDEDGYMVTEYTGSSHPKDTLVPKEKDIAFRKNYWYEKSDSMIRQYSESISYYNRYNKKLSTPDTTKHNFPKIYPLRKIKVSNGPYIYEYDDKGRLIVSGYLSEMNYLDDNTIRIKRHISWQFGDQYYIIKTNEDGQIVEQHAEENKITDTSGKHFTTFKYNEAGEMLRIESVELIDGQKSKVADAPYTTYSYHK